MSDKEELELLKATFEDFIQTSNQLQQSYQTLKEQAQRLSLYLSNIIESMAAALLVFTTDGQLVLWNRPALAYFPMLQGRSPQAALAELGGGALDAAALLAETRPMMEMECRVQEETRWLEINRQELRDNAGRCLGTILTVADKTAYRQLQLQSEREDRLRVMGEFAAEVAHEIRNPLASIELMTSLVEENEQTGRSSVEILKRIRNAVGTMNQLVSNILLYTRHLQPERGDFTLEELTAQSENLVLDLLTKKGIAVARENTGVVVTADFELMKQCLVNLLLNAAQAAPVQGRITVRGRRTEESVEIEVEDNGHGIPPAIADRVFAPFFTTRNTGTGLGLAMVKRVVEAHAGTIRFTSSPTGTLFVIGIPLQYTHGRQ